VHFLKPTGKCFLTIASGKNEGNALLDQLVGNRLDGLIMHIDMKHRHIKVFTQSQFAD